jgi:hypothetical protein
MKTLYILVNDCQDGSYSLQYTFNKKIIDCCQESYDNDEYCWPSTGCDGDGFSYTELTLPDECTYESLGISQYSIFYEFEE